MAEFKQGKGHTPFELMLFFSVGFKPQTLIKMGYNETTVYRYRKYFVQSQEIVVNRYLKGEIIYDSGKTKEN